MTIEFDVSIQTEEALRIIWVQPMVSDEAARYSLRFFENELRIFVAFLTPQQVRQVTGLTRSFASEEPNGLCKECSQDKRLEK